MGTDHHDDLPRHLTFPTLLAGRVGGDCPRRLGLFRHLRCLWHLLPDGGSGWFDAEMFRQHEDSLDPEHRHVLDGCLLQLPIYIYTGTGSDGSSHRNRTGHADYGRTDAVFPVGEVEDALTGQSSRPLRPTRSPSRWRVSAICRAMASPRQPPPL